MAHPLRRAAKPLAACLAIALVAGLACVAWWRLRPTPQLREIKRWVAAGEVDRAARAITAHLEQRPDDADVLVVAARIAAAQNDLPRCAELLNRVPAASPLRPEALFRSGQAWREAFYARRAEAAWREALRLIPTEQIPRGGTGELVWGSLIELLSLERRSDEATQLAWQVYPHHPRQWRLLIRLSRLQGKQSMNPELTVPTLRKMIERDAEDPGPRFGLAVSLSEASEFDAAIAAAEQCLKLDPAHTRALEVLLAACAAVERWEAIDRWLARFPTQSESALILRARARRAEAARNWAEAEQYFRDAIRTAPHDDAAHYQLAQFLIRRNQREQADPHLAQYRRLKEHVDWIQQFAASFASRDPATWSLPDPEQCLEIARHAHGIGRTREARAWLTEALRQRPDFAPARQLLDELPPDDISAHPARAARRELQSPKQPE